MAPICPIAESKSHTTHKAGRRDEGSGFVELKSTLPKNLPVLATRFENLKEGAPALVKGPAPTSEAQSKGGFTG